MIKQEEKDHILAELEQIEEIQSQLNPNDKQLRTKMQTYFDDHYSKMKEEIGINENFGIEEEDPKLE